MCSARSLTSALLLAGLVALAGCQKTGQYETTQLSPAPILRDEAMTYRTFDRSSVLYANGTSTANVTLFPYVIADNLPDYEQLLVGPALFYGQAIALPVTAIVTPPWEQAVNRGVYTPPSYTAVPVTVDDARWFR